MTRRALAALLVLAAAAASAAPGDPVEYDAAAVS
jgi:hypothetical protein